MVVGFAIIRASAIKSTWSTLHLARAALELGHEVLFIEPWDFQVDTTAGLMARAHSFFGEPLSAERMVEQLTSRTTKRTIVALANLDILLVRAAPLDQTVLTFALLAEADGVEVVNSVSGSMLVSHKAWLASLPDVAVPSTIVTRSRGAAFSFVSSIGKKMVVKPARGSGGVAVSIISEGDEEALDLALDQAAAKGDGYVVIQEYLTRADEGEVRLIWIDGEVLGGYLRERAPDGVVHNLRGGGIAKPIQVLESQITALRAISKEMVKQGIRFAGVDMIGDQVVEVNVLNPGGVFHADRLNGTNYAQTVITRLLSQPST